MAAGGLKGALLTRAVNAKLANWRQTGSVKHTLYDALVFRKVRKLIILDQNDNGVRSETCWVVNSDTLHLELLRSLLMFTRCSRSASAVKLFKE